MKLPRVLTTFLTSATLAYACNIPPPDHTLPVRDPNKACVLVKFSGCRALAPESHGGEEDAGADEDASSP